MKATIDLDDALYRRLKVEAARRGRTVRELVTDGIRCVLDTPAAPDPDAGLDQATQWFGALSGYGSRATTHDLGTMRDSIAQGRMRRAR